MLKKILVITFLFTILINVLPIHHIHDDTCGYNIETKEGCKYEVSLYKDEYLGD